MKLLLSLILLSFLTSASSQQSNVRYITETSRAFDQISKTFPYDIALKNAAGELTNSAKVFNTKSKQTVILFWLTTCGPCRMELQAIAQKFESWKQQKDFDFYAISIDFPHNTEQFYAKVKSSNWPFPAYLDVNREFSSIMPGGLNGLPQLFVLDNKGTVLYHTRKYIPGDEDKLFQQLKITN